MADDRDARIAQLEAEIGEARAELQRSNVERGMAQERQTATAEILRVIAGSPGDVRPVLDAIAENAARLCGSQDAMIFRVDGDVMRPMANFGANPAFRI